EPETKQHDVARHRPIEQSGVEARQAPVLGDALGERALTRRSGPVDGDDHRGRPAFATKRAPMPSINATNCGKLVATMPMSSTVTGSRLARPIVRNAMAMRWSR